MKAIDRKRGSVTSGAVSRRTAITTAGLAPLLALHPGFAIAEAASLREHYTQPVRDLLRAIGGGRLPAYLRELNAMRPIVSGLQNDRGDSLLARLKGVPLALGEGSFLLRARQLRMDVLLPDAETPTGGAIAEAQFSFVHKNGIPSLKMAAFGPATEGQHRPSERGVVDAAMSAAQIQTVYDALAAEGGGTLFFPSGTYRLSLVLTNRNVRVVGEGMGASTLMPAMPDRPVIEAAYNSGSWQTVEIADLSIAGDNAGDGFRAGHVPRMPQDEFIGRTRFRNVRFANLRKCINRPYGQIGLWLQNCVFEAADYHLHSIGTLNPGEAMHSGNVVARDCHFSGARKAVFLMKSGVTGTGQITFDHCIMEMNSGYIFYVDTMNGTDGVPGMLVRSCWNEANGSAASVTIDQPRKPAYAYLKNASLVRFEDTPIGDLDLTNAVIATQDCPLDRLMAVKSDEASTLVHRDARGFGSFAPRGLVESLAASYQFGSNRALSFGMPVRTRQLLIREKGVVLMSQGKDLVTRIGNQATEPAALNFSASRPAARVGIDQAIGFRPGQRVRLPFAATVPKNSWIAWICECRLASGPAISFSVVGTSGISAPFPIDHAMPRSVAGMSWCETSINDVYIEFAANDTGPSNLEIGRTQLVGFGRRQDALDYINSHAFLTT